MKNRVGKTAVSGGGADPGPRRRTATSDRPLVRACLRGDDHAWAALIQKYKNLIYSIPLKYGGTPEDAADIFQRVCLELFNELPRLRNTDNLRPWLMTVTAHQAYHWKRKQQRVTSREADGVDPEGIAGPLPAALASEVAREQVVREAIARLPERCQELVRMLFYEDPPRRYADVAKTLGLAEGSIGFIRGRCLHRLHRRLEELGF